MVEPVDLPAVERIAVPRVPCQACAKLVVRVDLFSELDFLRWKTCELQGVIDAATESEAWHTIAPLEKRLEVAMKDLRKAQAAAAAATATDPRTLPETQLAEHMEHMAREMPDAHLEIFVREYARRHQIPLLRLVGGGDG